MLTLTSPVRTWAHRMPAPVKLGVLCLWTLVVVRLEGLWLIAAAASLLAMVASGGRVFFAEWLRMLRPLWPFVVLVAVWQVWLRAPLGAVPVALRLVSAVGLANAVTMTTELAEIVAVLTRAARPLQRFGLPARTLAISVALMIRFVPVMLQRYGQISDAWRARSAHRPGWRILMPVLLAALDDAERVAEALRARGGVG
jgi:biotin transport system permease protein